AGLSNAWFRVALPAETRGQRSVTIMRRIHILPHSRMAGSHLALCLLALLLPDTARAADSLSVRAVAFSPDGKLLAATTGEPNQPGAVILWEVATRKLLWQHA